MHQASPPPLTAERDLALALCKIARAAGAVIMNHYQGEIDVMLKSDASPVTLADQEANDLIVSELKKLTPHIPIIAEESVTSDEDHVTTAQAAREFWLVDPLDGTKEFIKKNGDFTVNIALIREGAPYLGVVYPPTQNYCYLALGPHEAVLQHADGVLEPISARAVRWDEPTIMVSRSHRAAETDAYLAQFERYHEASRGSSLKLCLIARGEADLYPRHSRTMEWDIAAGHAILSAAGGAVSTLDGSPLRYGKPHLINPHFIASGMRSTEP